MSVLITEESSNPGRSWSARRLAPTAVGVSASRRTDVPALFGRWFEERLGRGWAEYRPAGPPRTVRVSLEPEDVTHFNFWTRWPRPFLGPLERVLKLGFPVLFNVTVTGLGRTEVEPFVPRADRAVRAVKELSTLVPAAAIQWRYDPVFLSARYGADHHVKTFRRLATQLVGSVGRVTISFVEVYSRRVAPDLRAYERETKDRIMSPSLDEKVEIAGRLREIATELGLTFTVCCDGDVRRRLRCSRAGCNHFGWASEVYPELLLREPLPKAPKRPDCGCSREVDIGAYDTCVLGCRYSYGSCSLARARSRHRHHQWTHPSLGA